MGMTNDIEFDGTFIEGSLHGRRTVYCSNDNVTSENVLDLLNEALSVHLLNLVDEEELYWYRRGITPILNRKKQRNSFITNRVTENHASEIVTFKNGYFMSQPATYIARNESAQDKVDELNEYLYRSGKQRVDKQLVDWFHTVGRAALFVRMGPDKETPVLTDCLDPRSAFVVYSLLPGNRPIMGVNMVVVGDELRFDVFTENNIFRLIGTKVGKTVSARKTYTATATQLVRTEPNLLGAIPIIEYSYDSMGMAAFEAAIPLLNAINNVMSNRIDGVEQFIQSLAIAVNCQFEDGMTADDIKRAGMIVLKSNNETKADFKILSDELDQVQTQVLVDYLYQQVLTICAMPSVTKGGRSTSDTGAAVMARDGWYQANLSAKNTEDLFMDSNMRFDAIFLEILRRYGILTDIKIADFRLNIVRNETENVQSKAQAFQTMLSAGLHPELAALKSGISSDPVSDIKMSERYMLMMWGDPDDPATWKRNAGIQTDTQDDSEQNQTTEEVTDNGESDAV